MAFASKFFFFLVGGGGGWKVLLKSTLICIDAGCLIVNGWVWKKEGEKKKNSMARVGEELIIIC